MSLSVPGLWDEAASNTFGIELPSPAFHVEIAAYGA